MKSNLLRVLLILFLLMIFIFITAKSYANSIFENLTENVFRLHILANSDSNEDQELKLQVRDEIIKYIKTLTSDCKTKNEVISIVSSNLDKLVQIAKKTITQNGYNYDVTVELGNFYFPTKYYGNVSMPAGNYDAIRIKIGKAEGKNWWCSLFPSLCFTDVSNGIIDKNAEKTLKSNLNSEEYTLITSNNQDVKFKFKLIELFNKKN
ncbi:MAG: stage II sporulation protein R [Clostridia bacterium]|nr:stage II sporulation protein R [Clostridia bacterium]